MQTRHLVETMETSTNTIGSSSHSYNRMPDILSKNRPPALYPIPRICEIPPPPPDPIPGPRATFRMPGLGDRTGRRRQIGRPHAARDAAHHGLPLRCGRRVPEMPESSSDWTTPPFRETAAMESDGLIAMDTGALVDVNSGVHFAVDRAALDSIVSSGSLHAIVSL